MRAGRAEARPPNLDQQVEVLVMQLDASFISSAIAFERPSAATAIAAPMIARMSAYSAAEAPRLSRSMLMKLRMSVP